MSHQNRHYWYIVSVIATLLTAGCSGASSTSSATEPSSLAAGTGESLSEARVVGTVSDLAGSCPTLTFSVGSERVATAGSTQFLRVLCGALRNGDMVEAQGRRAASGVIAAAKVQLEDAADDEDRDDDANNDDDEDAEEDEVELVGRVAALSGPCPNLSFSIDGRRVTTSASTLFRRVVCETLVNGQLVEVEGPASAGGVRAEKVQLEDATGVQAEGTLAGLSGACPSISFTLGGRSFFTSAATEFKDLSCSGVANGSRVRADGHLQSNGRVLAERVRR